MSKTAVSCSPVQHNNLILYQSLFQGSWTCIRSPGKWRWQLVAKDGGREELGTQVHRAEASFLSRLWLLLTVVWVRKSATFLSDWEIHTATQEDAKSAPSCTHPMPSSDQKGRLLNKSKINWNHVTWIGGCLQQHTSQGSRAVEYFHRVCRLYLTCWFHVTARTKALSARLPARNSGALGVFKAQSVFVQVVEGDAQESRLRKQKRITKGQSWG